MMIVMMMIGNDEDDDGDGCDEDHDEYGDDDMVTMNKHGEYDHEHDRFDDHVCEHDIDAFAFDIAPFLLLWFLWLLRLFAQE